MGEVGGLLDIEVGKLYSCTYPVDVFSKKEQMGIGYEALEIPRREVFLLLETEARTETELKIRDHKVKILYKNQIGWIWMNYFDGRFFKKVSRVGEI